VIRPTEYQIARYLHVIEASRNALKNKSKASIKKSTASNKTDPAVKKAKQIISRALTALLRETQSFPLPTNELTDQAEHQRRDDFAEKAQLIVTKTIRTYSKWSSVRLAEAEDILKPYLGLPVQFDLISLLGLSGNEAVFCRLLAWLLNPEESHGLGDAFLRLFLAHLGLSAHGSIFDFARPIKAAVTTEVSWDVPKGEDFFSTDTSDQSRTEGNARRLRVDILLLIQGFVIPIEAKIYAKESLYKFRGEEWAQAALYGKMWQLMLKANSDMKNNNAKLDHKYLNWNSTLKKCVEVSSGLHDKLHLLDNGRAEVVPVLIHPTGLCRNADKEMGTRQYEHGMKVWHVSWLEIDRILYRLCRDRDLQAGRLDLIRSFRTTILKLGAKSNLVARIEDLRLRMAEPTLTRRFPIQSSSSLKAALFDLKESDKCCAIEIEITSTRRTPNE